MPYVVIILIALVAGVILGFLFLSKVDSFIQGFLIGFALVCLIFGFIRTFHYNPPSAKGWEVEDTYTLVPFEDNYYLHQMGGRYDGEHYEFMQQSHDGTTKQNHLSIYSANFSYNNSYTLVKYRPTYNFTQELFYSKHTLYNDTEKYVFNVPRESIKDIDSSSLNKLDG